MILKIYSEEEFNILKNTHKEYSYNKIKVSFICSLCKKESIRSFKSLTIPFLCKHCKNENNEMICPFNKDLNHLAETKHQCMIEHNVKILTEKEIKLYLDYINKKYGNGFLKQFKQK